MANFQPKIGQDATFAPAVKGHKSTIFYHILTVDTIKITSLSIRIEWWKKLSYILFRLAFGCWPIFDPMLHRGNTSRMDPTSSWVHVHAITPNP